MHARPDLLMIGGGMAGLGILGAVPPEAEAVGAVSTVGVICGRADWQVRHDMRH
jgi:hypothetical protein